MVSWCLSPRVCLCVCVCVCVRERECDGKLVHVWEDTEAESLGRCMRLGGGVLEGGHA